MQRESAAPDVGRLRTMIRMEAKSPSEPKTCLLDSLSIHEQNNYGKEAIADATDRTG